MFLSFYGKHIQLCCHLVAHPNVPIWRSRLQLYGITSVILDEKYLSLASMEVHFETVSIGGRQNLLEKIAWGGWSGIQQQTPKLKPDSILIRSKCREQLFG
jgi:hypothetical protein